MKTCSPKSSSSSLLNLPNVKITPGENAGTDVKHYRWGSGERLGNTFSRTRMSVWRV